MVSSGRSRTVTDGASDSVGPAACIGATISILPPTLVTIGTTTAPPVATSARAWASADLASALGCVGVLDEPEQLLPQADELLDRSGTLGALRRLDGTLRDADGSPQFVEALAFVGGQVERLQLQGDGHQPGPALAGERQRRLALPALRGGKGGLGKQWPGLGNQIARLGIVEPLAEQQQESLAGARIGQARLVPISCFEEGSAQKPPGAQMVARQGLAREDRERRLVERDRLLQVVGPARRGCGTPIGVREVVLRLRPLARQGLARCRP